MSEQLKEINDLIKELEFTDKEIKFREQHYAFSAGNKMQVLTNILYSECYAKKIAYQQKVPAAPAAHSQSGDVEFIKTLSENNFTTPYIDYEWTVKELLQNNFITVTKAGYSKTIPTSLCINAGYPVQVNALINIHQPKEDAALQPGFYYAYSNQPFAFTQTAVRVYWNLTSAGASILLSAITKLLNQYRIPFILKCLNDPALYIRRDSAVLYLDIKYYKVFKWLLPDIQQTIKNYLMPDVPLFTYKYAEGIGIAEHPLNNESFGLKIMKIMASAIIKADGDQITNPTEKIDRIKAEFIKEELDFNNPFLNKGSKNNLTKDESE